MSKPAHDVQTTQSKLDGWTTTETPQSCPPSTDTDDEDDAERSPAERALDRFDGAQYGRTTRGRSRSSTNTTEIETTCRYCDTEWTRAYARIIVPTEGEHASEMHGCRECRAEYQMSKYAALPGPHKADHRLHNGGGGDA